MPKKIHKNRDRIYFKEVFNRDNNTHCEFMDYIDTIKNIKYYQILFAVDMLTYVNSFQEMKKCFDIYCMDEKYPRNTHSLEVYKIRFGEKEGIKKFQEYCNKVSHSLLNLDMKNSKFIIDPKTNKRITCRSYKFWMIKYDYTEEEARKKTAEISKGTGKKAHATRIKNPDWKENANTNINYFLKKGLSQTEALLALKQRQTTFTIEKCIKKYGFEEGTKKYFDRQNKWVQTLKNLPIEEKLVINRKRKESLERYWKVGKSFPGGFSKGSQEFAIKTYNILKEIFDIDYKNIYYATHEFNCEYFIIDDKQKYKLYDFAIKDDNYNIIIEYHGLVWHPKIGQIDFVSPVGVKYDDAFNNDEYKKKLAIEKGFDYYSFYENEDFVIFIQKLFKDMYAKNKNKT